MEDEIVQIEQDIGAIQQDLRSEAKVGRKVQQLISHMHVRDDNNLRQMQDFQDLSMFTASRSIKVPVSVPAKCFLMITCF